MNIYLLKATADTKFLQYSLKTATTAAEHLKGSVKGSIVGFAVCAAAEVVEWWATDNSNIADLLGVLVSTAIKAYIGAVVCSLAMSIMASALGVAAVTALGVLCIVGVGLVAGILIAMALERIDSYFEITKKFKTAANIGLALYRVWLSYLGESSKKIIIIGGKVPSLFFIKSILLFRTL